MPFTPIHMGPGLALKAAAGRHFSLMVFGFSQVAMDIEPLVGMMRGDPVLHGFTHTYAGATLIGLVSVIVGRPVCQFLLEKFPPDPKLRILVWLKGSSRIGWPAAIAGAFAGTYSHVALDSVMHADMAPWSPWTTGNGLLHVISTDTLHALCGLTGVLGALVLAGMYLVQQRSSKTLTSAVPPG